MLSRPTTAIYKKEFATIANGDYYSAGVSGDFRFHDVYIEFYSSTDFAPANLITKDQLSGTVTFTGTPVEAANEGVGEEYLSASENGSLTLGTADYSPAIFKGLLKRVKVNFSTIAGAGSPVAFRLVIKSSVA